MDISAVDLFCGAGGLTKGLSDAGISVDAGVDSDPKCEFPYTYNNNSEFILDDIRELSKNGASEVSKLFDQNADITVLAGCAPCQPFSPLNHGSDSNEHSDWSLLRDFLEIVRHVNPDIVTMENVYEIRRHDIYQEFVQGLSEQGYWINSDENKRVYCPEYDIPQKRKRWVVLASQRGPISLSAKEHESEQSYPTVQQQIESLPRIKSGETHNRDPLHRCRDLAEVNIERLKISKPGTTWERWKDVGRDELLLSCHKKDNGRSFTDPYGRMVPSEPAPTITTQFYNYGSGRFGHYDVSQDRALSLREGAVIQTFPQNYKFAEDGSEYSMKKMAEMIGNAVPPKLGEIIGKSIVDHVSESDRQSRIKRFHAK